MRYGERVLEYRYEVRFHLNLLISLRLGKMMTSMKSTGQIQIPKVNEPNIKYIFELPFEFRIAVLFIRFENTT